MIIKKTSTTCERVLSDLLKHTRDEGECKIWLGCLNTDGYARIAYRGNSNIKVHRLSYQMAHGGLDISGHLVMHTCDNPRCINPDHLVLGTYTSNNRDRAEKGRSYRKLTPIQIRRIYELLDSNILLQKEIAMIVGCDPRRVSDVRCGLYDRNGKFIGRKEN